MLSSRKIEKWSDSPLVFEIEECGGDGDCLFHSIAVALGRLLGKPITMHEIRQALAHTITERNVDAFVKLVSEDQRHVRGDCQRVRELIKTDGHTFQGTDGVLRWLVTHQRYFTRMNIGFACFNDYGPDHTQVIGTDTTLTYILLYNNPNSHWRVVNVVSGEKMFSSVSKAVLADIIHVY
jgi:hypothetical protein